LDGVRAGLERIFEQGEIVIMQEIFTAIDKSTIAELIRSSTWAFAALEVIHLLGITVLLGCIFVANIRLFGAGLSHHSEQVVAESTLPWTYWGMGFTIASGILLFSSEALKCYASPPFFWKMGFLAVSLILTFATQRRLASGSAQFSGGSSKLIGLLALVAWFGTGVAGRAIAFF
jgi:hypothetical protein